MTDQTDQNEQYLHLARDAFFSSFNRSADITTPQEKKFRAEVPPELQQGLLQSVSRSFLAAHDHEQNWRAQRRSPVWDPSALTA